jgi:hypothetical protein
MAKLRDAMVYICLNYPHKDDLSKTRLTKMIYLCDWRSSILHGTQITDVVWKFNHYGPYVEDIILLAEKEKDFSIEVSMNIYGNVKEIIKVNPKVLIGKIKDSEKKVMDYVIEKTAPMYWNEFIKLVYSTYPILSRERCKTLNLPMIATEYKKITKNYDG